MTRFFALALLGGCAHIRPVTPHADWVTTPAWHTMTSQQRVQVTVHLEGHDETRSLRALLAVERPDRFRLRALGPAGLTLFDLLVRHGEAKVLRAIRHSAGMDEMVSSLAADLEAAYLLDPGTRTVEEAGKALLVRDGDRTVRLSDFSGTPSIWHQADIETPRYRVKVTVDDVKVDPALDPSMFAE